MPSVGFDIRCAFACQCFTAPSHVPLSMVHSLAGDQTEIYNRQMRFVRGIREMITRLAFKVMQEVMSVTYSDRRLKERDWSPKVESIN